MINLLPPDVKSSYLYARRNVALRRWVVLFAIALVGLGLVGTYGLLNLRQSTVSYQKQISGSQAELQKQDLKGTQKHIQDISNSFKLAVKVMSQEILFSKLLEQMGTVMPPNSSLAGLTIQDTTGGMDIVANAIDYNTATQVQVNLADPRNKIFTKADIVSINCNQDGAYPCKVQIRALFAQNNPFLFINSTGKKP